MYEAKKGSGYLKLLVYSVLGFAAGGAAAGYLMNVFEFPLAFIFEGLLGGLGLGLALANREALWRLTAGAALGLGSGFIVSAFVGLVVYDGLFVPELVSGVMAGVIMGAFLRDLKAVVLLSIAGAVGFILGDAIFSVLRDANNSVFAAINQAVGQSGWAAFGGGFMGLFHGLFLALGLMLWDYTRVKEDPSAGQE